MPSESRWTEDEAEALADDDVAIRDGLNVLLPNPGLDGADPRPNAFFTVTNLPGTVSATAVLGGRLQQVDVHDVSRFDEAQLAEEILELAALAKEKAQAAQHEVIVELMRRLGHDRAGMSAFLTYSIGLPSFDVVSQRLAAAFAARHASVDD